jgi:hypothetical protein
VARRRAEGAAAVLVISPLLDDAARVCLLGSDD